MTTLNLSKEIAAFLAQQPNLATKYPNQWVVFVGESFKGHFAEFSEASTFAVKNFGAHPFLIRRTDDPQPEIPMMVLGD